MSELKKFTKDCAVDVRGWDELPYGEVMFNAIMRVGDGEKPAWVWVNFDEMAKWSYLFVDAFGEYELCDTEPPSINKLLTPVDILGEHLVKAIEEGYMPYFEGDEMPRLSADVVFSDGGRWYNANLRAEIVASNVIAYKPIEQSSIQAKVLSEKVGPSILSRSCEELTSFKTIHDEIEKLTATEEAKAANLPYIQGIIDQRNNKEGE